MNNKLLGAWGEELAKKYLLNKGYKIREINLHLGHRELDLIAQKKNTIFFFEVKTRFINTKSDIDNYLSQKQIINLKKAAYIYAATNKLSFENLNFGLITITLTNSGQDKKTALINLYLDIF